MTLPLPSPQVADPLAQANFDTISTHWTDASSRSALPVVATQTITTTTYATMPTPNQATISVPVNGFICVLFKSTWSESVAGAARAAIFLGSNQAARATQNNAAPVVQEADLGVAARASILTSYPLGLVSGASAVSYTGDLTTGMIVGLAPDTTDTSTTWGGPCCIWVGAAGTYTVSIRVKSTSGSVSFTDTHFWAWAESF